MRSPFPISDLATTKPNGGSVRGLPHTGTDKSVSEEWFAEIVDHLIAKDAGLALHLLTGFEERSCYRYAAGTVRPPAYFLRALLRSEQGWTWLSAVMEGSKANWWIELLRARRVVETMRGE